MVIPEDLTVEYRTGTENLLGLKPSTRVKYTAGELQQLIKRIAELEAENATLRAELAEAKSGWDSCIADLYKALRFARARKQVRHLKVARFAGRSQPSSGVVQATLFGTLSAIAH